MNPMIIIHSSTAVSPGVRLRNHVVFTLSWVLWGAMLLQLVQGIGRHGVATLQILYTDWIDPRTAPTLGGLPIFLILPGMVLLALLGWSLYQRRQFRRARAKVPATGGNDSASCSDDVLCPIDVVSWYFGVDPRRLRLMQRARNVVIHHHADGRVAEIRYREHALRNAPTRQSTAPAAYQPDIVEALA